MDDFICYANSPVKKEFDGIFKHEATAETNDYSFERGSPNEIQSLFDQSYFFDDTETAKSGTRNSEKKKKRTLKTYPLNIKLYGSEETKQTKNIVKNYGNAMIGFVISPISLPYLERFAAEQRITVNEVHKYYSKRKGTISGIKTLRHMLDIKADDSEQERRLKTVFRLLSIVFVKYYSVNWIFSGKLKHKLAHLKFRFSILRRVQNPSTFTYLKN